MSDDALSPHLRPSTCPLADPANVIRGDQWRITVLDAGVVRLEWSPSGRFEDRASQAVLNRSVAAVPLQTRQSERAIEVITHRFHLVYDRGPFSAHGLSLQVRGGISNYHSTWRFGQQGEGNLGGTARTLDEVDGRTELEDGILARHGVACYDDSHTALFTDDGWFAAREPGSLDLYLFAFGRDYREALRVFHRLTGETPLLPRWALGNWWSRYHRYTAATYLALLDRFTQERLPFSVAVLDMDWHLVDIDPRYGSGWTGYTWNRELFPDPQAFLAQLHRRGLHTTLNVHPADGICAHEEAYQEFAKAVGQEPASELPVMFDPTDPGFLRAYLEQVHHRLEAEGVDFWWLDWQQGRESRVAGLDPLWLLNHLHFLDASRPGGPIRRRPIILSRYAGVGSHRYPVGFSGDAVVSWDSLAFQPEFTARASNVGYSWWSHDIGGHMFGVKDDELATRWVQLGVFSPILRLHSTQDVFNSKEPWRFNAEAEQIMGRYLRLRHQLLPYLATMAHRAHQESMPLVEPMYYEYPHQPQAYEYPNQYRFGTALLVAPVVQPADRATGLARTDAWLPPGEWVDLSTGVAYHGGRELSLYRRLSQMPVFARAGAVIPMQPQALVNNFTGPSAALEVLVVAGADGAFELVEDNDDDAWASTLLRYEHAAGRFTIGAVQGQVETVGAQRSWSLRLVGFGATTDAVPDALGHVALDLGRLPTDREHTITLERAGALIGADVQQCIFRLLDDAQIPFATKTRIWNLISDEAVCAPAKVSQLLATEQDQHLIGAISELLLARDRS